MTPTQSMHFIGLEQFPLLMAVNFPPTAMAVFGRLEPHANPLDKPRTLISISLTSLHVVRIQLLLLSLFALLRQGSSTIIVKSPSRLVIVGAYLSILPTHSQLNANSNLLD